MIFFKEAISEFHCFETFLQMTEVPTLRKRISEHPSTGQLLPPCSPPPWIPTLTKVKLVHFMCVHESNSALTDKKLQKKA